MPLLTWNEIYSVNVNDFNEDHKKLFGYINEMNDAMQLGKGINVLPAILTKLTNYTVYHFSKEEKLMKIYSYPGYDAHKMAHDKLIVEVKKLKQESDSGNRAVPIKLMNFLHRWLVEHIQNTDRKYSSFFNEKGIK